jgi:triosephosphate isomerase
LLKGVFMRTKYIAGNWKMNNLTADAVALSEALAEKLAGTKVKVMIAPPFTALAAAAFALENSGIRLGAQNCFYEEKGAYTGEISPQMLKDSGVSTVILGHSERRSIFGETDEVINKKIKAALKAGLEVILCVGETLDEREAGRAEAVVEKQLKGSLAGITEKELENTVIAYEPVWAIGTGKNASPSDAQKMHLFIRKIIEKHYSKQASDYIIIQYGGSVKAENASELLNMPDIDGALVGGASLNADGFAAIVNYK